MPLFSFEEPEPKLNPPISCWREDMPENHEPQLVPPQLHWLTTLNDTFLEIPRYSTEVAWGGNASVGGFNVNYRYWQWSFWFCHAS